MFASDETQRTSSGDGDPDGRVIWRGLGWSQYEAMLAIRADQAGVRLAYLEGALEIVSPSRTHERIKTLLSRLIEAYAEERDVYLNGYGSLTMKSAAVERGAEPDECYVVGADKDIPDLVVEVVWTSGGLDKRRLYAGLGIRELWQWEAGRITVFALRAGRYEAVAESALLPGLDLALVARLLDEKDQTQAVRTLRATLRTAD